MSTQRSLLRAFCVVAIASAAACSGASPVAPGATSAVALTTDADGQSSARGGGPSGTPGTYEILFRKEVPGVFGGQPLVDNTLNVGESLVLMARVTDAAGTLATAGRITYEYCSLDNVKVQSSACESGPGRWKKFWTIDADPYGSPLFFGTCTTPRVIGFRLRFGGGGGIAAGVSAPKDVTWQ